MLNDGVNNVPNKVIAVFTAKTVPDPITYDRFTKIVKKPDKKRDWFSPHFYHCLPLVIGNQYGFVVSCEFPFSIIWDGTDNQDCIKIFGPKSNKGLYPIVMSHFGSGILSLELPVTLRTPPGVNLLTFNPPNHLIPNLTVMSGVIEADNLRHPFTFNLRVGIPNIQIDVPEKTPLAAFLPIPRYFGDAFSLKDADKLFSSEILEQESKAMEDASLKRKKEDPYLPNKVGRRYFRGVDMYNNPFNDHQTS